MCWSSFVPSSAPRLSVDRLKAGGQTWFRWVRDVGSKGHLTFDSLPFQTYTSVCVISLVGMDCNEAGTGNYALNVLGLLKQTHLSSKGSQQQITELKLVSVMRDCCIILCFLPCSKTCLSWSWINRFHKMWYNCSVCCKTSELALLIGLSVYAVMWKWPHRCVLTDLP